MDALGVIGNLVGEIVSPSRCAACDWSVAPNQLFCAPCAASVLELAEQGRDRAGFEYGGAIATAIVRLKYEDRADIAPRLGAMLRKTLGELAVDLVIPVPLHPHRLAIRGYNQAALLARPVARALGARFEPSALLRLRDTPRQQTLDRAQRLANVRAAFVVADRYARRIRGARVLVVDDVRTTGATLDDCRRALEEEGAREVVTLACAARP